MPIRSKKAWYVVLVFGEAGVILVLVWLVYLAVFQKQARSVSAIRLDRRYYLPFTGSKRFPHYYEPSAGTIINDHPDWLGYNASYSINKDTLNERDDYPVAKAEDTFRIVVLGDSFTYGLFVNTMENYTEQLEDALNAGYHCGNTKKYEILNLGVPAYDVGYATERFYLRGEKYSPDLVVWFMNWFTFLVNADRKAELEAQFLNEIPLQQHWQEVEGKLQYYPGMRAWLQHTEETSQEERIRQERVYFSEFIRGFSGRLLVVANDWGMWLPPAKRALEEEIMQSRAVEVYRMPPLTSSELLRDGHPNSSGHKKIADSILAHLAENGLIPCSQDAP